MEIKKIKKLDRKTTLKLLWNMSIADYNNNRLSEKELKTKYIELLSELLTEYWVKSNEFVNGTKLQIDWRSPLDVIELKEYRESRNVELKMVA